MSNLDETHNYLVERLKFLTREYSVTDSQWAAALSDASVKFKSSGFGRNYNYRDVEYKSLAEYTIAKWLGVRDIEFEYEPHYDDGTKRKFDFYVPALFLYIEYFGLIAQTDYRVAVRSKREAYNSRRVLEIFVGDDIDQVLTDAIGDLTYVPAVDLISQAIDSGQLDPLAALLTSWVQEKSDEILPQRELLN